MDYKNYFIPLIPCILFGNRTLLLLLLIYISISILGKKSAFIPNLPAFLTVFMIQANTGLILEKLRFWFLLLFKLKSCNSLSKCLCTR